MNRQDSAPPDIAESLLGNLNTALLDLQEPERYRTLSLLLARLADLSQQQEGRATATVEQVEALNERVKTLDHERAMAVDEVKTTQADLERAQKQLQDETTHGEKLKESIDEQRSRLDAFKRENEELKAEVVGKNNALHKAEVEVENLTLQLQRAEHAGSDRSSMERLEKDKSETVRDLEQARQQLDQLRLDKDGEIERLEDELRAAKAASSEGGDALLAKLWQPLGAANPPLVEGHVSPTSQSAERLFGAFIELSQFVDKFDRGVRPFLTRYTKHHPSVKVPWDAYSKGDDLLKVIQRTIAPVGGRPVGVLKMRLRLLVQWTDAAMIGCDSAIESIASELEAFIRSEMGIAQNPNKTLKEFLRDDGHELFLQKMREIRSGNLGDAFGRGG